MRDRTKVMIAIAGTALVVGGTTAIAGGKNGGGSAGSSAAGTAGAPQTFGVASGNGPGAPPAFHGGGPRDGLHGDAIGAAATYLGLTPAQLMTQLQSGKSLAEIAAAQGKTVAGLKDAIHAAAKTRLDQEVSEGHLTAAQAKDLLAELDARLDDIVQNKGFAPHWRGHDDRPGGTASFRPAVRA